MSSLKKISIKTGRVFLWILLGIVGLVLLVFIFINTPYGKTVVKNQLVSFLSKKLDTRVTAKSVDYSLPKWVRLKDVYVEDQHKDTLLFGGALGLDISMLKLINGEIDISKVSFENIVAKINRPATDSVFNYQFVLDAFTTGAPPKTVKQDTSGLQLTLEELILKNVVLSSNDAYAGNNMNAFVNNARLTTKIFQPDKLKFFLDELDIDGLRFTMKSFKGSMIPDSILVIDTAAAQENGLFISGNRLKLRNAYVSIDDEVSGMHYENNIGNFKLTNVLFNLAQSVGTADSIFIDSSNFVFKSAIANKAKIDTIISNTPPWFFKAANLYINETNVKYDDVNKPKADGLDFVHLDVTGLKTGINDFLFSTDTTRALITQLRFEDKSGFKLDSAHASFSMTGKQLVANEVYIQTPRSLIKNNFLLTYDSIAAIKLNPRNSFITTTLDRSRIAFNDLYYLLPALKTTFPPAQFAGQYLDVNTKLQGNLAILNIPYLQIVGLTGTRINARGVLYNLTDAKRFAYDLQILSSTLYKRDLVKLLPKEQVEQLKGMPDVISLTGRLKGDVNNIAGNINTNAKDFAFNGNFKLTNISDPTKLKYDFDFGNLSLTKSLILGFIPPTVVAQINLPNQISAKGKLSGNSSNLLADLALASSYGNAKIKGYINNIKDPDNTKYDLAINTGGFNVGRLLRQDSVIGVVAGNFKLKGTSFDVNNMQSDIAANMTRLDYNGYSYSGIELIAKLNRGLIGAKGSVNDPNAALNFDINANIKNEYPTMNGTIQIDTMQLQNLNLYDSMFNFSGLVNLDVRSLVPRRLDADVYVDALRMQFAGVKYFIDTIALNASNQNGIDSIKFSSPFANAVAGGAFDYDKIGISLQQYINNYYKLPGVPVKLPTSFAQQQISFKGNIQEHPLIKAFVPGLVSYKDIDFSGKYDSNMADSALDFNASIPALQYLTYKVSEGKIGIESTNEQINYDITFDTLNTGTKLLYGTFIRGAAAKDSISLNARTQDSNKKDWFGLAGTASVKGEEYNFTLKDSLILNYEKWDVQRDNFISYSKEGILVQNVRLANDTSVISINSLSPVRNSPIDINIKDFDLATIASIASGDTLLASGVLNVRGNVSDFNKKLPGFTGTAEIKNLQVYQSPVGNISAKADKVNDGEISASMRLDGNGNDVNASLNYYLNNTSNQFDAKLDINALGLRTIQAFSAGQLINSGGNITGNIVANGKFIDPRWKGQLGFDTAKFTVTQLGTPYFIDKQTIFLDYPNVRFPKFTLTDSLGHTLLVDGDIRTNSDFDLFFNLKMKADDFTIVNAKRAIESQFFGYAAIDADVNIAGTGVAPTLEGSIFINDKSNLTILLPEANYAKQSGDNLVRFIDRDTFDINPPVILFKEGKEANNAFAQFLNYNLNIQVNKEAVFTIVLDPITGDEIKVQGDARLNAGVDPGGNIVLAGVYNLDQGYYDFNYQFINRKFLLDRGSTISFAGDPLDAVVDITASYIANTTAGSLLSNEISNADPTLANGLRQKLPFEVKLTLTGELNKPKIKFNIVLPEEGANVNSTVRSTIESKLAQIRDDEAAMNREVFSLLVFGRFVGEQSSDFFKGNDGGFSDIARQSVSQFLNEALDEIAGNLIKGVNIDLNLNSYQEYGSGNATDRTDLNIAVSKSFLNDRLTVSVGQNFGIEGQDAATKAAGKEPGFKPDISLGYKLTQDGKYLLRAYTKNQYEATVDGFVVETGLSFVLTLDYDKFKELFQSRKKK